MVRAHRTVSRVTPSGRGTRFRLLGVGAMRSPCYAPAGLLIEHAQSKVVIDGGTGCELPDDLASWLVTDIRGELIGPIRRLARARNVAPGVGSYDGQGLTIDPYPVVHTSHPAFGYLIVCRTGRVVWAPEFFEFPTWAAVSDLMFADAAAWDRPIRFARGTGGHAPALQIARQAQAFGVRRVVFAHIGRPTIAAINAGRVPPIGEFGIEGAIYRLDGKRRVERAG